MCVRKNTWGDTDFGQDYTTNLSSCNNMIEWIISHTRVGGCTWMVNASAGLRVTRSRAHDDALRQVQQGHVMQTMRRGRSTTYASLH